MTVLENSKSKIRTMEELSTAIGISRPTLSKFFQDADSVRNSTRNRIEEALEDVDYVPNFFATRMNRRSTRLIGVVVPFLNDLFYTTLIQIIEEVASERGYTVVIQSAHGDAKAEAQAFQNMISMSADGVITAPIGQTTSLNAIKRLKENMPIVFVDSRFPDSFDDVDFVGTNNQQSIALMVNYLYQSGEAPVFFGMPRINSNSLERENAYIDSALESGFTPAFIPIDNAMPVWNFEEFAYTTMKALFSRGDYTDRTILCANDRMAIGVIKAANEYKLLPQGPLPEGIGKAAKLRVAGHDDYPLASYVNPALTTVSRNTTGIGRAAVELILDQIENGRHSREVVRTFDAELRLRESA